MGEWRGRAGRPEQLPCEMLKALGAWIRQEMCTFPGLPRAQACRQLWWSGARGAGLGWASRRPHRASAGHGFCVLGLTVSARRQGLVLEQTNSPGRYTACESWSPRMGQGEVGPSTFLGVAFSQRSPTPFLRPLKCPGTPPTGQSA